MTEEIELSEGVEYLLNRPWKFLFVSIGNENAEVPSIEMLVDADIVMTIKDGEEDSKVWKDRFGLFTGKYGVTPEEFIPMMIIAYPNLHQFNRTGITGLTLFPESITLDEQQNILKWSEL